MIPHQKNTVESINDQTQFLEGRSYIAVWRREHIARLLKLYVSDLEYKKGLTSRLSGTVEELDKVKQELVLVLETEEQNIAESVDKSQEELERTIAKNKKLEEKV